MHTKVMNACIQLIKAHISLLCHKKTTLHISERLLRFNEKVGPVGWHLAGLTRSVAR